MEENDSKKDLEKDVKDNKEIKDSKDNNKSDSKDKSKDTSKTRGNDKNTDGKKDKEVKPVYDKFKVDATLCYLKELQDYDRCIQAGMVQKVIIEKKIRDTMYTLAYNLGVYDRQNFDKDKTAQIIKLLDLIIQYDKVIQPDIIQRTVVDKLLYEVIASLEEILDI